MAEAKTKENKEEAKKVQALDDAIKQIERETEKSLGGFSGLPGMGGLF